MQKKSIEVLAQIQARCALESLKASEGVGEGLNLSRDAIDRMRANMASDALNQFARCWFGEKHPETQKALDARAPQA